MARPHVVVSRRCLLLGIPPALACGASRAGTEAEFVRSGGAEHWSVRYTGVAPSRILVQRDHEYAEYAFFDRRSWSASYGGVCVEVSAAENARSVIEVYSYPGLDDITVMRGVPPNIDPRVPSCTAEAASAWSHVGRAPSGVDQYAALSYVRLFVLPGGTWIFASRAPTNLLGAALAQDASPPPKCDLEPSSRVAQLDLGHEYLDARRKLPQGLVGREFVVARTTAEFSNRSAVVKFHFATSDQASNAADSVTRLLRAGAAQQRAWSSPLPDAFAKFMATVSRGDVEGTAVLLHGQI